MSARREAILRAVDNVLTAYDEWATDEADVRINPDSHLADRLEICDGTITVGDVPQDCMELVLATRKLMVAYRRYQDGEWMRDSLEPTDRFYAGIRAVQAARVEASPPEAVQMESVAALKSQGVSDQQVAKMHGSFDEQTNTWSGPFHNANGAVLPHLIEREAATPGSVLPEDWVHPNQIAAQQRFEESMRYRLERIDNRAAAAREQAERRTVRPSEQEIVEYIQGGAFPNQVLKQWKNSGLTMDDINEIISRHGLTPSNKEEPTAPINRLSPEDAKLMEPPPRDADEQPATEFSNEAFAARVLELAGSAMGPKKIRTQVQQEFGRQFSPQRIAAVIRDAKSDEEPESSDAVVATASA